MNRQVLSERIKQLATYKEEKKRLSDLVKENNGLIEEAEREVIAGMLDMAEDAGLDDVQDFNVTVEGRRYGVIVKPYYSIKSEDRDTGYAMLKELGLGDLVVEKVDDRTLTKALEQLSFENGGELPDEYAALPLSRFEKTTISDRKA